MVRCVPPPAATVRRGCCSSPRWCSPPRSRCRSRPSSTAFGSAGTDGLTAGYARLSTDLDGAAGEDRATLDRLTTDADFARGRGQGTGQAHGTLRMVTPIGTRRWHHRRFEYAQWTSAWVVPGQRFTRLVPSWTAATPPGSWIQVVVRVRDTRGRVSSTKVMGRWSTPASTEAGPTAASAGP